MPIVLYNLVGSPPCGFIRSLAKEIGVELRIKDVDFIKKEQLPEDFVKINPFRKVPAINDDGFAVYESNAIAYYLLRKYAPESELYPNCVRGRTRIDHVLAVASGFIQAHLGAFFRPRFFTYAKPTGEEVSSFEENICKGLENLIGDKKFAVGDKITIADLCLLGHVTFVIECGFVDRAKFPKLSGYYERVRSELPSFNEIHVPTVYEMKEVLAKLK